MRPPSATLVMGQMEVKGDTLLQARMIGTNEQGVPMIHLYRWVVGCFVGGLW